MRFSAKSRHQVAGLAAALMLLPVAVSCAGEPVAETGADASSEIPSELAEGPSLEGELDRELSTDPTLPTEGELAGEDLGSGESIVEVAEANGSFETLLEAVEAAGLESTLSGEGPYTVFAPTDEAFAALPEGTVEKLVQPENQAILGQILAYHVVPGAVESAEIQPGAISTVEGSDMEVAVDPAGVTVNGQAAVVQPDVIADNGVIHVVDTVLLPPAFDPATL